MTEFLAWAGTVGTFVFGSLSVFQFLKDLKRQYRLDAQIGHIETLQASLHEAVTSGEVIKTEEARQFVRQVAWHLAGIKAGIQGRTNKPEKAS